MFSLETVTTAGLVAIVAAGAWFDLCERRVPNVLTIGGLALGLGLGALGGSGSFGSSLIGAGLAFVISAPLFLVGGLGGGDVKLLTAVGAFVGLAKLPIALASIAIVGGIMAALEVVRKGAVRRTLLNLQLIFENLDREAFSRWKGRDSGEALTVDAADAITVPYAVAIALGAVLAHLIL